MESVEGINTNDMKKTDYPVETTEKSSLVECLVKSILVWFTIGLLILVGDCILHIVGTLSFNAVDWHFVRNVLILFTGVGYVWGIALFLDNKWRTS